MPQSGRLVWLDLEMTGLDPSTDVILEIATIVTDSQLNYVATGPNLIIHQSDEVLESMNDWCIEQHGASGLTQRVRDSKTTLAEAEQRTLDFLKRYVDHQDAPLCGNSVWQDRRFLAKYMPKVENYLHYRIIDVSTIKELVRRWFPHQAEKRAPKMVSSHRALDDIEGSILELRHYRDHVFNQ